MGPFKLSSPRSNMYTANLCTRGISVHPNQYSSFITIKMSGLRSMRDQSDQKKRGVGG